jgi:hypothetical protein
MLTAAERIKRMPKRNAYKREWTTYTLEAGETASKVDASDLGKIKSMIVQ